MEEVAAELIRVVEAASERLEKLSEEEAEARRSTGGWSKKEILGHLIDSAANNHHRFIRAQQVDELVFPAYEQDEWVRLQDYSSSSWSHMVGLWRLYNLHLARVIRRISPEKLETVCKIGSNEPVTLRYLVEDYLRHLKHHLERLG